MKRNLRTTQLVAAFLLGAAVLVQGASAQQCCCDRSGLIGAVDLTFMKYMQEGGVADADGEGANFDLEWAPRFELGYMGKRDLGLRSRYWFYDAHTLSNCEGNSLRNFRRTDIFVCRKNRHSRLPGKDRQECLSGKDRQECLSS